MIIWWVDKSIPPLSEIMLCITHFVSVLSDRLTEVQWKAKRDKLAALLITTEFQPGKYERHALRF